MAFDSVEAIQQEAETSIRQSLAVWMKEHQEEAAAAGLGVLEVMAAMLVGLNGVQASIFCTAFRVSADDKARVKEEITNDLATYFGTRPETRK